MLYSTYHKMKLGMEIVFLLVNLCRKVYPQEADSDW